MPVLELSSVWKASNVKGIGTQPKALFDLPGFVC